MTPANLLSETIDMPVIVDGMNRRDLTTRERGSLTTAQQRVQRAEDRLRSEKAKLDALILDILERDVTVVSVSRTLDMSREWTYQALLRARQQKEGTPDA